MFIAVRVIELGLMSACSKHVKLPLNLEKKLNMFSNVISPKAAEIENETICTTVLCQTRHAR